MSTTNRKYRKIRAILAGIMVVAFALLVIYRWFPSVALAAIYQLYEWQASADDRSVTLPDGYEIPFYDIGDDSNQTLIFLHGYGDRRIAFLQAASHLKDRYHIVLPTLPGYGATHHDEDRDHSIESQARALEQFVQALGLNRFVLSGNSMGGHISVAYADLFPGRVEALVLLNPAGVDIPPEVMYDGSEKPLESEEEFQAYMNRAFVKVPWVPGPFMKFFIAESQRNFEWQNELARQIRSGGYYRLREILPRMSSNAPIAVIWGDGDQIITPDHAPLWTELNPRIRLHIIEDCGHGPQYELPAHAAHLVDGAIQQEATLLDGQPNPFARAR